MDWSIVKCHTICEYVIILEETKSKNHRVYAKEKSRQCHRRLYAAQIQTSRTTMKWRGKKGTQEPERKKMNMRTASARARKY